MKLYFLQAANGIPLAKNLITGDTYPPVSAVTSIVQEGEGLEFLHNTLIAHSQMGHVLLTGGLDRDLNNESRAGHFTKEPTSLLVLDIDSNDLNFESRNAFLDYLGIGTSYIFQHSAGSQSDDSLRGHYFIELDKPTDPNKIQKWLMWLNMTYLNVHIKLANQKRSLKWPIDVVVNQPGRIIYIAPPITDNDPINDRIICVNRDQNTFTIPNAPTISVADKVNELRDKEALKIIPDWKEKTIIDIDPNEVRITEQKENHEFVYLNLNGGDSWAYFINKSNPEIVHNFKGEPSFYLAQLNKELYKELSAQARPTSTQVKGIKDNQTVDIYPLCFRDPDADIYYQVLVDTDQHVHGVFKTGGRAKLNDFMRSHGGLKPAIVHDWKVEFNPGSFKQIDEDARWLNLFKPTPYMLIKDKQTEIPPRTEQLIRHLTVDQECYNHFINWLAAIYQYRIKTGTAWLFHGHTGTGKGTLFEKILKPMFGYDQVHECTLENAVEEKNEHMERCIMMFVDEFNIGDVSDSSKAFNKLKNYITEKNITIRAMRTRQVMRPSFTNFIFGSNNDTPIITDESDRRINFAPRQTRKLETLADWRDELDSELEDFCKYLNSIEVDIAAARDTLKNETRTLMIEAGRNPTEEFFRAVQYGDIDYFVDLLSTSAPSGQYAEYSTYEDIVTRWVNSSGATYDIEQGELMEVYKYTLGEKNINPTRFNKICQQHNIVFKRSSNSEGKRIKSFKTIFNKTNPANLPHRGTTNKVVNLR